MNTGHGVVVISVGRPLRGRSAAPATASAVSVNPGFSRTVQYPRSISVFARENPLYLSPHIDHMSPAIFLRIIRKTPHQTYIINSRRSQNTTWFSISFEDPPGSPPDWRNFVCIWEKTILHRRIPRYLASIRQSSVLRRSLRINTSRSQLLTPYLKYYIGDRYIFVRVGSFFSFQT